MADIMEGALPAEEYVEENFFDEEYVEEDVTKDLFLLFELDEEDYALAVTNVAEIISLPGITPVPHVPEYVEGIINLRGDIVPVVSVRRRFMKPLAAYDERTCIIVVTYEEYTLGLIVDAVKGVAPITEAQIAPPPNVRLSYSNMFIRNIGQTEEGIRLLLDLEKVIFEA